MNTHTLKNHIEITPGVMGGSARISGHRITVKDVVIWHERMGLSADEIVTQYHLTLSDVYAALAYYYDHQQEIDEDIRKGNDWVDKLRQQVTSKLTRQTGGA